MRHGQSAGQAHSFLFHTPFVHPLLGQITMVRTWILSIIAFIGVLGNAAALPQDYGDLPTVDLKPLLIDPIRKWSSNTTVSFPNSPAFEASTERWTIADPPTYVAAIRPGTEEDISKVVSGASNSATVLSTNGQRPDSI